MIVDSRTDRRAVREPAADWGSAHLPPPASLSLGEILRFRAERQPDRVAFVYLEDGERATAPLTYGTLDAQASALAGALRERGVDGRPVLLAHRTGLEFVAAFFGCLYAGAPPVAAYVPGATGHGLDQLRAIAADVRPAAVVGPPATLVKLAARMDDLPALAGAAWIAQEDDASAPSPAAVAVPAPEDLAYLQYTSGSTARPRGVMIAHGPLLEQLEYYRVRAGADWRDAVMVGWLPHQHDFGLVGFVLSAIYTGLPYVFMRPSAFLRRPARWLEAIVRFGGTYSGGPTFAYDLCTREVDATPDLDLSGWTIASIGGEPIAAATLERFARRFAPRGFDASAFLPSYGLAEAVLCVSARHGIVTSPREGLVSVGTTLPGQRVTIVDPDTRTACSAGELGEIWVAGASLASGYWGRPAETAETFGATLAGSGEGPFLRTGDLGLVHDGELFVADRRKDVIVVRGRNHHPHDIERTAQATHRALRSGHGAAFADADGRVVLVQELRDEPVDANALMAGARAAVAERHGLELHAIALIAPGTLPKTASGKVQRHAVRAAYEAGSLPTVATAVEGDGRADGTGAVEGDGRADGTGAVEGDGRADGSGAVEGDGRADGTGAVVGHGRVTVEDEVALIWADVLGVSVVAPGDDFFALGGDSLAANRILARIGERFGVELPLASLFEQRTVAALAERVQPAPAAPTAAAPDAVDLLPLSDGQREIVQLASLGAEAVFHVLAVLELTEPPDEPALRRALARVVRRHDALRSVLEPDGLALRVLPDLQCELPVVDVEDIAAWLRAERVRGFELTRAPLWRATLVRGPRTRLVLTAHHLIADGGSMRVLTAELSACYAEEQDTLPAALQPAEYRRLRERRATPEAMAAHARYWLDELGTELPVLELPADRPRPRTPHFSGAAHGIVIDPELRGAIERLARRNGCTLFMALLAGYSALLHRLSGQDDLLVAFSSAGRHFAGAESAVGTYSADLPVRSRMDAGRTVTEHLLATRDRVLGALEHQDHSLAMHLDRIGAPVDPRRPLPVAAAFSLQTAPQGTEPFALDLDLQAASITHSLLDLELSGTDTGAELRLDFIYDTDLFDAATVRRFAGYLVRLLEGMAAAPERPLSELPILSTEEQRMLLGEWSDGGPGAAGGERAHELFERRAAAMPDTIAVADEHGALTYSELSARSDAFAARLHECAPGAIVALLATRGTDYLAALLGILKAGAVYLPLDPRDPHERLRSMLARSGAAALAVDASFEAAGAAALEGLDARLVRLHDTGTTTADGAGAAGGPQKPAYVIYTSGSTGAPKGAVVSHAGLVNHLRSKIAALDLAPGDVVAQTAVQSFDISVWQFLAPVLAGATVRVLGDDVTHDPARLLAAVDDHGVTIFETVPSILRTLLEPDVLRAAGRPRLRKLRWIIPTGETLPPQLCRRWLSHYPRVPLLNAYGPSECSDDVTLHAIAWPPAADAARVPIGRPIPGARVYVLDQHEQLVPAGTPGELYVGGVCVGLGYLNDPERTATAFVPDPFTPGRTLYRTGDLVRHRNDGTLEFLGRIDDQEQINGVRIEPGEIEAVLGRHPAVRECAVAIRHTDDGAKALAGYVALRDGAAPTLAELRSFVRSRLPQHMVPATITEVESIPLNANGKLDRAALPKPTTAPRRPPPQRIPPRTQTERGIAAIWAETLPQRDFGIHDDFFELGGRSLDVARLVTRLRATFDVELPVFGVYREPSLAGMARLVEQATKPA